MRLLTSCLVTAALFLFSPVVSAAEQIVEEIIVTATKREESIQDVPIAVSAFSGADLEARGVQDIYGLRIDAELVTLSGCGTALGETVRGEGLVGIVRGFMYAGAPRVLASVWPVSDRVAAEMMMAFYGALNRGEAPPVTSPRAAMECTSLPYGPRPRRSSPQNPSRVLP